MKKHKISYSDTQSFSKIVQMYTEERVSDKFYNRYPNINQFEDQIKEKQSSKIDRDLLYEVLKNQNSNLQLSEKTIENIELLRIFLFFFPTEFPTRTSAECAKPSMP